MKKMNVNGFTVLYERIPSNILNIRCIVNVGSTSETKNNFGIAHYLEHMFFKGTLKKDYKEVNRITSELGDANAYTSRERTVFHISTLTADFKKAASILVEMLFEPAFPPEEFEKEKTVILEEYQSNLDSPNRYFFSMAGEAFLGTPRGHKVVGNKNSILNMQLKDLKEFRENHYVIDNLAFAIAGNISEEEVLSVFNELLADIPSIYYGKLNRSPIEYGDVDYSEFAFNHKSKQAIIALMSKGLNAKQDYETNHIQSVFTVGIGGGMHSLMFDRIREELGLCYSVGMYPDINKDYGCLTTYCLLDKNNIDTAKMEMLKIYDKVKTEGFDPKLLEISKKNILFSIAEEMESSNGYGYMFMDDYFSNDNITSSFDDMKSKIDTISNDDIIKFANEVLNDDNCKFVKMTQD